MKKHIIITGAGSGIGRSTAIELAKETDIQLILIGRTKKTLVETQNLLQKPNDHQVLALDITKKGLLSKFLKSQSSKLNLFGIFANAGTGGENTFGKDDRWLDIMNVNLNGTYYSIMEALPFIQASKEKYKNIVITSSCLARFGVPNYTDRKSVV